MAKAAKKPKRKYTKRATKPIEKPEPLSFGYRAHAAGVYRVWRSDWFGDQFELMVDAEFRCLIKLCGKFGILIKEAEDD